MSEGPQARGNVVRHHLKDTADGIARAQRQVHFSFHTLLSLGIGTVEQDFRFGMKIKQLLP